MELFADASAGVAGGLLVILDEAGLLLEGAVERGKGTGVEALQELAELANRSGQNPILFLALLHQAFESYAANLSVSDRAHWAKVQGRFEDIPFQESSEQVVRFVAASVRSLGVSPQKSTTLGELTDQVSLLTNSHLFPDKRQLSCALLDALPIHPVACLALGPIFRGRLGQNERSLFAFLDSAEPNGFRDFLFQRTASSQVGSLYSLDRLYDYLISNVGPRLTELNPAIWTEAQIALQRLPSDAPETDGRVVKTIAMLAVTGVSSGLVASRAVLRSALSDSPAIADAELTDSLRRLCAASILVYRKFSDSYHLWGGSDLDVPTLIGEAAEKFLDSASLLAVLERIATIPPLVARRHLRESGTLRYFAVKYATEASLGAELERNIGTADGLALLLIPEVRPSDGIRRPGSLGRFERPDGLPVVVGVARQAESFWRHARELAAIDWIQGHTAELSKDPIARRELDVRRTLAEGALRKLAANLLGEGGDCDWHFKGARRKVRRRRDLEAMLSKILTDTFSKAPQLRNELINRRQLSSAAAAARRNLMQLMFSSGALPRLGIEGTPPEMSIYRSVLEETGLHRGEEGFDEPFERSSLWPTYRRLLDAIPTNGSRARVSDLYAELSRPPFGVREGVLPILLTAIVARLSDEIALYEDESFIPAHTGHLVERFLRTPDRFAVQRSVVDPDREAFLRALLPSAVLAEHDRVTTTLVVRELARFVRSLPDYAKFTNSISPEACAVRNALLRATEPGKLVFEDLPGACGHKPVSGHLGSEKEIRHTARMIKAAMRELSGALPRMMKQVLSAVLGALGVAGLPEAEARDEIRSRAANLRSLAIDDQLGAYCVRLGDHLLDLDDWVRSLATFLAGKPPEAWADPDFERAKLTLRLLTRRFEEIEHFLGTRPPVSGEASTRLAVVLDGRARVYASAPASLPTAAVAQLVGRIDAAVRPILESAPDGLKVTAIATALTALLGASAESPGEQLNG